MTIETSILKWELAKLVRSLERHNCELRIKPVGVGLYNGAPVHCDVGMRFISKAGVVFHTYSVDLFSEQDLSETILKFENAAYYEEMNLRKEVPMIEDQRKADLPENLPYERIVRTVQPSYIYVRTVDQEGCEFDNFYTRDGQPIARRPANTTGSEEDLVDRLNRMASE